jgi:hypothetical protein
MLRNVASCVVTSAVTFAVASGTGLAGHVAIAGSVQVGVGDSAHFTVTIFSA